MTRSPSTRALLLAVALIACRRDAKVDTAALQEAAVQVPTGDAAGPVGSVLAARCHPTERAAQLDDGQALDDLDIGDGVAYASGYAVGIVHRVPEGRQPAGRQAAVALWGPAAGDPRIVDLAPSVGDAPPPRLASCRDRLLAAAFAPPRAAAPDGGGPSMVRDLAVYMVDSPSPGQAVLHIAPKADESFAFDLACSGATGIAVWGETAAGRAGEGGRAPSPDTAARGVIRGASFAVGKGGAVADDLSPPDSDAEMPRVVPSGAGFLVLWLARRPDATKASDGSAAIEAIGEARTFGWLEVVAVDGAGKVVGPVRRVTPSSGHVSAYDVLARSEGSQPAILVVARDDGESIDGAGGSLLRVRVQSAGGDPPVALATDGLGRGAPAFVDGPLPWLAWIGPHEEVRLLPLDGAGEGIGPASAEDGLDEARPLISSSPTRVLVAAPRDKAGQLRVFDCQR